MMLDVKKTRGGAFHKIPTSKLQREAASTGAITTTTAATGTATAATVSSQVLNGTLLAEQRHIQQQPQQVALRGGKATKLGCAAQRQATTQAAKASTASVKYGAASSGNGSSGRAAAAAAAAAASTNNSNSNSVRLANQKYFLLPSYKDPSFLKAECELAHAQVTSQTHGHGKKALLKRHKNISGDDCKNNNNNNNNSNTTTTNGGVGPTRHAKAPAAATTTSTTACGSGALLNGMRRPGALNGNQATATNRTGNGTVHRIDIKYNATSGSGSSNRTKVTAPPAAQQLTAATTAASTTATSNSSTGRNTTALPVKLKPLSLACNGGQTNRDNNNGTMNNNNNNNNGNNNMRTQQQQHDDISYIDSDDTPPTSTATATAATAKASASAQPAKTSANAICYFKPITPPLQLRNMQQGSEKSARTARPKSTIISSNSNFAASYEKFNSYKNVNGLRESSVNTSNVRRYGIDSLSIKASIEKFNNLSEQKRLPSSASPPHRHAPVEAATQAAATGGSSSNLQQRYSSDLDSLRMTAGYSSSLTRPSYRTNQGGNSATAAVSNVPSAPMGTAGVAPTSKAGGRTVTGMLVSNGGDSLTAKYSRNSYENNAECASTSAQARPQPQPLLTTAGSKVKQLPAHDSAVSHGSAMSASASSSSASSTPIPIDSARNAARSVLPPVSPTSSRYLDRDRDINSRNNSNTNTTSSSIGSSSTLSSYSKHNSDDSYKSARDDKFEGLCGLRNIGNTCFMNSVIQCLSHTTELTRFLRSHHGVRTASTKDQQILHEFAKLIQEMWTANVHSVTPMELKRAFSTKHRMYSDYNQQDAQEFLRFFLDSLHSALNSGVKGETLNIDDNLSDNKKADLTWEWYARHENSLIRDLFVGQLKSTLKCTTCGNTSVTFDPFWDLSVSLPSLSRCKLEACLDLFIREEVLDGDEMPTCSKCKTRRKCTKSFTIQRFPKYLVIHLKRFSETRWSKLSNIVEFPTTDRELNMGLYGANSNSNVHYSLYAISNHMGSTAGGHYVALCKHPVSRKWHEFNDNIVSDALSENYLVSSSAYILFYERA